MNYVVLSWDRHYEYMRPRWATRLADGCSPIRVPRDQAKSRLRAARRALFSAGQPASPFGLRRDWAASDMKLASSPFCVPFSASAHSRIFISRLVSRRTAT